MSESSALIKKMLSRKEERNRKIALSDKIKQKKFSISVNPNVYNILINIAKNHFVAFNILLFFILYMDKENSIMCEYSVLQTQLNVSEMTICRALKILKELKLITIVKSGTNNVYFINVELLS
jgi:Fe2+ or Zn2+ uptake regulation protein